MLEFSKNVIGIISLPITESDIENIITISFKGGSNYWMGLDDSTDIWINQPENISTSQWATKLILEGKSIKLYNIEQSDDDSNWVLTLEKLLKGIELNAKCRSFDANLEDMDATTADCIIQYALFGKVVYVYG